MQNIDSHYPVAAMDLRAFWDLCKHFSTHFPEFGRVRYNVEGESDLLIADELDFVRVMRKVQGSEAQVRKIRARFQRAEENPSADALWADISFSAKAVGRKLWGLSIYAEAVERSRYYVFEELIYESFEMQERVEDLIAFGHPCEILAMVVDIRGFSVFCEQPKIESPYTCGLMSAFYSIIEQQLRRWPPNMLKFLGDGVLAVWETQSTNRDLVVAIALAAAMQLEERWQVVCKSPRFSLGAPAHAGVGLSFGLASRLEIGNDYLGRPINIAARLCNACPEDRIYVDHAVPALPLDWRKEDVGVMIKPFGRYQVQAFFKKNRPKGMRISDRY